MLSNQLIKRNKVLLIYLFIPKSSKDVFVMTRVTNKLSFKESNINDGGVEVDKLENENFEGQVIIVFRLCSVHFYEE